MPPASTSLLYTWSFESVLLGLAALALASPPVERWAAASILTLAGANALLHVGVSAADLDLHHEVSLAYVCSVAGIGLAITYAALDPAVGPALWGNSDTRRVTTLAVVLVVVLVAVALAMSSCQGATPLLFHKVGHAALLWPLALVLMGCVPAWLVTTLLFAVVGVLMVLGALEWVAEFHAVSAAAALALFFWQLWYGWSLSLLYSLCVAAVATAWLVWSVVVAAVGTGGAVPSPPPPPAPAVLPTPSAPPIAQAFRLEAFRGARVKVM